jgi:sterol desaturase/sphingolipid hydroxylase (fatty acid hydroxylase superfamily)
VIVPAASALLLAAPSWDAIVHFVAVRGRKLVEVATSPPSTGHLCGILAVLALEVLVLGWPRSTLYRLLHPTQSTVTDVFYFLGKVAGYLSVVVFVCAAGLTSLVTKVANAHFGFHLLGLVNNPVLRVTLLLVASDFVSYWTHRGRHAWSWWWELHKLHHAAREFNAITHARGHPLDLAAIAITNAIPIAILGGTVDDCFLLLVALGVHAGLTHSMLDWSWGWFGKYVLFSPIGHRIHHSPLAVHIDKNFGAIFPIWDWMFGTLYTGDVVNETVGVDDDDYNRGVMRDIVEGTQRAARAALAAVRKSPPAAARHSEL